MMHAQYQTPPVVIDPAMTHVWVEKDPPRVGIGVAWERGDEQSAIAELTRAYEATLRPIMDAIVAGVGA